MSDTSITVEVFAKEVLMRVFLAAVAGAIIVFVVSAITHTVTPLGTAGLEVLPGEDAVLESLRANVPHSGLYMFPGLDPRTHPSDAETKAWEAKLARGPYGLLVITKEGGAAMEPRQLILEFVTTLIAALIVAIVIALVRGTYGTRACIGVLLPSFAFFSISASHWIWYRYPSAFILAELAIEVIAWLLAALAMAKIVRPAPLVAD